MSKERTTKDKVEYIASKFAENPGHFAATILKMYWDMEKERDCLNDKLNQAYEDGYQMEDKYRDMKTQRDTLIDDIAVLRANNEMLERENEQKTEVISLYKKAYEKTHKGWFKYRELTNHIRDMKFASPYSYNYIHLVNFIKELERADDGV